MPSRQAWTTADDQLLYHLHGQGLPRHEIRAFFPGRNSNAIGQRIRRLTTLAPNIRNLQKYIDDPGLLGAYTPPAVGTSNQPGAAQQSGPADNHRDSHENNQVASEDQLVSGTAEHLHHIIGGVNNQTTNANANVIPGSSQDGEHELYTAFDAFTEANNGLQVDGGTQPPFDNNFPQNNIPWGTRLYENAGEVSLGPADFIASPSTDSPARVEPHALHSFGPAPSPDSGTTQTIQYPLTADYLGTSTASPASALAPYHSRATPLVNQQSPFGTSAQQGQTQPQTRNRNMSQQQIQSLVTDVWWSRSLDNTDHAVPSAPSTNANPSDPRLRLSPAREAEAARQLAAQSGAVAGSRTPLDAYVGRMTELRGPQQQRQQAPATVDDPEPGLPSWWARSNDARLVHYVAVCSIPGTMRTDWNVVARKIGRSADECRRRHHILALAAINAQVNDTISRP